MGDLKGSQVKIWNFSLEDSFTSVKLPIIIMGVMEV